METNMTRNRRFLTLLTAAFALALVLMTLSTPTPAAAGEANGSNLWAGVQVTRPVLGVGQQTRVIFDFGNRKAPNFVITDALCIAGNAYSFNREPIFLNNPANIFTLVRMEGAENAKYLSAPIYAPAGADFRTVYTLRANVRGDFRVTCTIVGYQVGVEQNSETYRFATDDVIISVVR